METPDPAYVHLTSEIGPGSSQGGSQDNLELPGTSSSQGAGAGGGASGGGYCSSCSTSPGPHSPLASAPLTSSAARNKSSVSEPPYTAPGVSGRATRGSVGDRRKSSGVGGLSAAAAPGCGGGGLGSEEKHGLLHYAIPIMPLPLAALLCVLNIVAPGIGTLLASLSCFCCGRTRVGTPVKGFGLNLLAAVLQMLTFFLIVGWIWSILWGMTFVQLALCSEKDRKLSMSYYVRRQSSVE